MNPETAREDVLTLAPGAAVVYDEPLKLNALRDDLVFYPVPFDKLVAEVMHDAKLRRLVRNMIYDGVLSRAAVDRHGADGEGAQEAAGQEAEGDRAEHGALKAGYDYAEEQPHQAGSVRRRADEQDAGQILIEGNAAAAIGCMMAGVTVVAWYPITPSSSLPEALIDYLKKYRRDPETGKTTYAVVQAEDELAALGMVIGAGWAGARAMTSTAGPGISLMAEFAGLGYYAEVPAVIFDIQRVGPSTGLPTRTAAGDILSTPCSRTATPSIRMLLPASVTECYTMAMEAFDLAEQLQQPVFVMSDLDLGMNTWMVAAVRVSDDAIQARQAARRRDAEEARPVGPLPRRRWRRHPTAPSRVTAALVFRARLGSQRAGALQRAGRRLRRRTSIACRESSRRRRR